MSKNFELMQQTDLNGNGAADSHAGVPEPAIFRGGNGNGNGKEVRRDLDQVTHEETLTTGAERISCHRAKSAAHGDVLGNRLWKRL